VPKALRQHRIGHLPPVGIYQAAIVLDTSDVFPLVLRDRDNTHSLQCPEEFAAHTVPIFLPLVRSKNILHVSYSLHTKVEIFLRLEGMIQGNDEWMV
jgi:hypothetical protein